MIPARIANEKVPMNINDNIPKDILAGVAVSLVIEDKDDNKLGGLSGSLRHIFEGIHGSVMLPRNGGHSSLTLRIPVIPNESKRKAVANVLINSELTINRQPPEL